MCRFKKGLNGRIQSSLAVIEPNNFDKLMGVSISVENDIKIRECENKLKHPHYIKYQQSNQQFKKPRYSGNQTTSSHTKGPNSLQSNKQGEKCQFCGFAHTCECHSNTGACFCCGNLDHLIAQCTFPYPRNGPA